MDKDDVPSERKCVSKTKSLVQESDLDKLTIESGKRKSTNVNDTVKSLDLALCRLKKSKLVSDDPLELPSNHPQRRDMTSAVDMFIDSRNMVSSNSNFVRGIGNISELSVNLSHYELMRNMSCSDSLSEGTFSNNTSACSPQSIDLILKDERIEKYFRSIEKWNRKNINSDEEVNGMNVEMPGQQH